ncbi:MAG: hypothetical protein ACYS3N_24255 [Planctomycetota bacterium]
MKEEPRATERPLAAWKCKQRMGRFRKTDEEIFLKIALWRKAENMRLLQTTVDRPTEFG